MNNDCLLWNQLKSHISPQEVDYYAKKIGIARINRNEETFMELSLLRKMHYSVEMNLNDEIQRKVPVVLMSHQRNTAIERCVKFLDELRNQGHFLEPSNPSDKQIMKYLKLTRQNRPNSTSPVSPTRIATPLSGRPINNLDESINDVRNSLDEEYEKLQLEIQELRCDIFSSCDQLTEAKALLPPTTDSIEAFNKRLQQKEFTLKSMSKQKTSGISRLRDSVQLNRIWD